MMHVIAIGDRADPSFPGLGQHVPDVYLRPHIKLSFGLKVNFVVGNILQDVYHPKSCKGQPTPTYIISYYSDNDKLFQCYQHPSVAHSTPLPETRR